MIDLLLISSGTKSFKKDYTKLNVIENIYLNYGLLGIAGAAKELGYSPKMYQGSVTTLKDIKDSGIRLDLIDYPLMISIPSFISVDWAIDFLKYFKSINNSSKVILGGRWVIDKNIDWCKRKFSGLVDTISVGCGESKEDIIGVLNCNTDVYICNTPVNIIKELDYKLIYKFKRYQPVIEVGRGCNKGCSFCLETVYKCFPYKTPEEVIHEIKNICRDYGTDNLNFYFEAAMFNPNLQWSTKFKELYILNKMKFKWRFTTRVDTLSPSILKILSQTGLKVIDLGLESGSLKQLSLMGKSKNPIMYLSKAEVLIIEAHKWGIWCKMNILLFAKEDYGTISSTLHWLTKNKVYIKGVSVNPLTVYLNGDDTDDWVSYLEKITNTKINTEELYDKGLVNIALSNTISVDRAKLLSDDITDNIMTRQDYNDLKYYSYTGRRGED